MEDRDGGDDYSFDIDPGYNSNGIFINNPGCDSCPTVGDQAGNPGMTSGDVKEMCTQSFPAVCWPVDSDYI